MLRSLALAGVCVMLAGFALSSPVPPLSLSARLAAPGSIPCSRILRASSRCSRACFRLTSGQGPKVSRFSAPPKRYFGTGSCD